MAEEPLDCLAGSVQYPLATPSKHCRPKGFYGPDFAVDVISKPSLELSANMGRR